MRIATRDYTLGYYERVRAISNERINEIFGHFPFLDGAKLLLKMMGWDVTRIVAFSISEKEVALRRIIRSLKLPKRALDEMDKDLKDMYDYAKVREERRGARGIVDSQTAISEIKSYLIARIMISCYPDEGLINYFCRYEAEKVKDILERYIAEDEKLGIEENIAIAIAVDLGLRVGEDIERPRKEDLAKRYYYLHFADYLKYGGELLRNPTHRLSRFEIINGYLLIEERRFIRFLSEAIYGKMREKLPAPVTDDLIRSFDNHIKILKRFLDIKRRYAMLAEVGDIKPYHIAPCIRSIRRQLESGINISHFARLTLATYYIKLNYSEDDLIRIFAHSPDFNENIARYQIRHLMGQVGSTAYDPPACSTLISNGLCDADIICSKGRIRHPLNYFKLIKQIESVIHDVIGKKDTTNINTIERRSKDVIDRIKVDIPYFKSSFWDQKKLADVFSYLLEVFASYRESEEPTKETKHI